MSADLRIARRLAAVLLPGPHGLSMRAVEAALRVWYRDEYPRAIFRATYLLNTWGSEESVSGPGSTLAGTEAVRRELPRLLARVGAASLLDAPCGDTHWIARVDLGRVDYVGVDVVETLVQDGVGPAGEGARRFVVADIRTDQLPRADVVLCRDALVHLPNAGALEALDNFRRSGAAYLLATTFPGVERNDDIAVGRWRPLNLERPPFDLPPPVELVVEEPSVEEVGGSAKALGLWRLSRPS